MAVDDVYSKALLHFNGTNGSTTFTDESGKTWTAEGDAQLATAQKKFGTASLYLNGYSSAYIHTGSDNDFKWGTGAGAIDCWVRFESLPSSGNNACIFSNFLDNSNSVALYIYNFTGTYYLRAQIKEGGTTYLTASYTLTSLSTNTWYHVEWDRDGSGNNYLFWDGVTDGVETESGGPANLNFCNTFLDIGRWGNGSYLNAWVDEFRFTKGTTRHTSDFTPPTSEYEPQGTFNFESNPLSLSVSGVADNIQNLDFSANPLSFGASMTAQFMLLDFASAPVVFQAALVNNEALMDYFSNPLSLASSLNFEMLRLDFYQAPLTFGSSMADNFSAYATISVSLTLPALTATGQMVSRSISASLNLPLPVVSSTAQTGELTSVYGILPCFSLETRTGARCDNIDLPSPALTASAFSGIMAESSIRLPALDMSGTSTVHEISAAAFNLPKIIVQSQATQHYRSSAEMAFPAMRLESAGLAGVLGRASLNLPLVKLSLSSFESPLVQCSLTLPTIFISAHGQVLPATVTYKAVVLNTKNLAVTEYEGFNFNSFAFFKGVYLGANDEGIFVLDGESDNGTPIDWSWKTGALDFAGEVVTRPKDVWINARTSGDAQLTVGTDEQGENVYDLPESVDRLHELRVKMGRGIKGRYQQFGMKSVAGSRIDIDKVRIMVDPIGHRTR